MAKEVAALIKLQIKGGAANPSPPVGPALGSKGVNLYCKGQSRHYEAPPIRSVSTIGAGDNFNAGILFGLLKQGIRRRDLEHIDEQTWEQIIRCGMDLASEVCQSYDNYISKEFANAYVSSLK